MPQFTKNAISEAFFRIATKKTPEKITVKDIVEECGVTRNTFYYYFRDVYDVVEDAFLTVASEIRAEGAQPQTVGLFYGIADFLYAHRAAMRNICTSVGYDAVFGYLSDAVTPGLFDAVRGRSEELFAESAGRISQEDLQTVTELLREAVLGLLLEWLREDSRRPPSELLDRVTTLSTGVLDLLLQNAASQ